MFLLVKDAERLQYVSTFCWVSKAEPSSQSGPRWEGDRPLCRESGVSGSPSLWELTYQLLSGSLSSQVHWMFPKVLPRLELHLTHSTKTGNCIRHLCQALPRCSKNSLGKKEPRTSLPSGSLSDSLEPNLLFNYQNFWFYAWHILIKAE